MFPADLFAQPVDQLTAEWPVLKTAQRIEELAPVWIHPMHSGSLPLDATHHYFQALRNEPFAFDGGLFGRMLPGYAESALEEVC